MPSLFECDDDQWHLDAGATTSGPKIRLTPPSRELLRALGTSDARSPRRCMAVSADRCARQVQAGRRATKSAPPSSGSVRAVEEFYKRPLLVNEPDSQADDSMPLSKVWHV